MATIMTFPNYRMSAKLTFRECALRSCAVAVSFASFSHQCPYLYMTQPYWDNSFRRISWQIRSNVDSSGVDPSPSSNTSGGTRLIRAIQALLAKIAARIRELRKNLPVKLLFFLVGFYCATAFATVIGQTGDWDILSAALAVAVVEGIGALMYKASFTLFNNMRGLITMFNYWKAGLSLGLFLDSFKYEIDDIMNFSNPFYFELDTFSFFFG